MKACHVLLILFYWESNFITFSGDHKYYWHLVDIKWYVMYFMLHSVQALYIRGTLSYSNKVKNKIKL